MQIGCGRRVAGQLRNDVAADDPCLLPKDIFNLVFLQLQSGSVIMLQRLKKKGFLYELELSNCLPRKALLFTVRNLYI